MARAPSGDGGDVQRGGDAHAHRKKTRGMGSEYETFQNFILHDKRLGAREGGDRNVYLSSLLVLEPLNAGSQLIVGRRCSLARSSIECVPGNHLLLSRRGWRGGNS